ncbi:translation initiation factor IF-3 [Exophiala viscosa]|uniref:Translation initiation factor IF-3 n=1 Tax=Exophiala viscosa TaxID=2486360 RepID=A0AAN6DL40_9EURO|nr:translation initiation factor IF-3 [Exophiala viscosa]KAI1620166.1 translation initiation factor IF-3 [Exophiala viscosa]
MQQALVLVKPLLRVALLGARPGTQQLLFQCVPKRSFLTSPSLTAVYRRPVGKIQVVTIDDKIQQSFTLDEKIETRFVREKKDNKLSDPIDLYELLRQIDRADSHVLQLSKPGDSEAIVQIVQRKDLIKRLNDKETAERQVKQAQKEKKPKQIELNWAISGNDLQLKMKQLEEFLRKGKKVELLLAPKRHQRKATPEEAQALVQAIKEKVQEVGAAETAPMDGAILRQATMTVKIP